jgi:hypothetical protein
VDMPGPGGRSGHEQFDGPAGPRAVKLQPSFQEKAADIISLYVAESSSAVAVFCVDQNDNHPGSQSFGYDVFPARQHPAPPSWHS